MMLKSWMRIEGESIIVNFHRLEDLKDATEIMKEYGLTKCKIYLNCGNVGHGDELAFVDNISYLEEIDTKGFNINFYYFSNLEHAIPLKKVIEDEKRLDLMCEKIKKSNLSPLEKFIAVYDIVHFFKPYKKENEEEMSSTLSRNLYEYLNNDYMVCAGYADLLENLCKRVGIPCSYFVLNCNDNKEEAHARNYVHIDDPKYNIHGFYISDATQSEHIKTVGGFPITNYQKTLMTTKEQQEEKEYEPKDYFKSFNYSKEELLKLIEEGHYSKISIVLDIMRLDPIFGENIFDMGFNSTNDVEKVLNYIDSKINKPISDEILLNALIEAKKVLYPNMSESVVYDLKRCYLYEMGIEQEIEENLNISKMTLKEIKLQYPIYYYSKIFYVINTELKDNSCDNLSISWIKETERLRAFGIATSRIRANQDKIIKQGYQIDFNERGQINIHFPLLSNSEDIPLEEYLTLLNKQIQEFSIMVSSLSQEDKEIQQNIHTEKENVKTRIGLLKIIKALFSGKKNKKQENSKQIEITKQETPKTNDVEYVETINTRQHIAANSYIGNSENKINEMHDTDYVPINIEEMSKEQLEALKKQIEEEYSVDKSQDFSR